MLVDVAKHPLELSFSELSELIGGSGKARMVWNSLKRGEDPLDGSTSDLSDRARMYFQTILEKRQQPLIPVTIEQSTVSPCGTRKFLGGLEDGAKIESVLIPAGKFDRTTLCVSTQIGCDRGCVFCATGKMGIQRNLTASEIIGQVYLGLQLAREYDMPPMTNIVFMGMGDAGRNTDSVGQAVNCLADVDRFCFARSKVTVSSVGPSPEVFQTLADMPCTLAWSLHAADDGLRRKLVPSTRHTTIELREGLLNALKTRESLKQRTIMIAVTLIDGVNDRVEDAQDLANFVRPMLEVAPKIALDLIPYNDIGVAGIGRPSRERVNEFQALLRRQGFFCSVRVTRGDEEDSACGQLTTKSMKISREIIEHGEVQVQSA